MLRFLLILCFCLCTLSVAAWIIGHLATPAFDARAASRRFEAAILPGGFALNIERTGTSSRSPEFHLLPRGMGDQIDANAFPLRRAGFSITSTSPDGFTMRIPLYLPSLLFALLTRHLFRKHRRTQPAKGFEVQPTTSITPGPARRPNAGGATTPIP